jgi:hypothetical protein
MLRPLPAWRLHRKCLLLARGRGLGRVTVNPGGLGWGRQSLAGRWQHNDDDAHKQGARWRRDRLHGHAWDLGAGRG